jgi:hypothetical protein
MTKLELTIAVLGQLNQPYEIFEDRNLLVVTPTSSPMLECLPGEWVSVDDTTELHIDLTTGPFITPEYIAEFIVQVASTI